MKTKEHTKNAWNLSGSRLSLRFAWSEFNQCWRGLVVALTLAIGPTASAHDPGLSVATATRTGESLSIHLAMASHDVERLVALDAAHNGVVTDAEFNAALPRLEAMARQAFKLIAAGQALAPGNPVVELDRRNGLQFEIPFEGVAKGTITIQATLLDKLPRGHRQFLCLRDRDGQILAQQMLERSQALFTAQLAGSASSTARPHAFHEFLLLGIGHIATGYDHVLFLLGLLLVGGSLRAAAQIITSFTIAHSITLALATLKVVNIAPGLVEPLIAASIVFVGVQNILECGVEKRWLLTFAFGLIHGCGFASALRDLGLGAHGTSVVAPLLSFNLGVELGQLAIASLALPCIWKCRTSPAFVKRFVPVGSGLIVLAGGYWLIERIVL